MRLHSVIQLKITAVLVNFLPFPEQSAQVSFPGKRRTWDTILCLSWQ